MGGARSAEGTGRALGGAVGPAVEIIAAKPTVAVVVGYYATGLGATVGAVVAHEPRVIVGAGAGATLRPRTVQYRATGKAT